MIEESARVLDNRDGEVLLETVRSSSCSACSAKATCGQGLMGEALGSQSMAKKSQIWVRHSIALVPGTEVTLCVEEETLSQSALLAYLFPLLGLIVFALIGQWLGGERWAMIGAGLGLVLSLIVLRELQKNWLPARLSAPFIRQ